MTRPLFSIFVLALPGLLGAQVFGFFPAEKLIDHPQLQALEYDYPALPLDFNGDGRTDLITHTFANELLLYAAQEDGSFVEQNIAQGLSHAVISAADFDYDGDPDVVTARAIFINEGQDSFTFINLQNNAPFLDVTQSIVATEDMNGDSLRDLVILTDDFFAGSNLQVWLNQGDNTFGENVDFFFEDDDFDAVRVGDLEGDGDLDIVFVMGSGNRQKRLVVLLQNPEDIFEPLEEIQIGGDRMSDLSLELVDLEGDGDLDIVGVDGFSENIVVIENQDTFRTTEQVLLPLNNVTFVRAVDLNRDSLPELVAVVNTATTTDIYQLLNQDSLRFGSAELVESFAGLDFFGSASNSTILRNNLVPYDYNGDERPDLVYTNGFVNSGDAGEVWFLQNATWPVSTNQPRSTLPLTVFPNPAQDLIRVGVSEASRELFYQVVDLRGRVMLTGFARGGEINVSPLTSGLYTIVAQTTEGVTPKLYTGRFLKVNY